MKGIVRVTVNSPVGVFSGTMGEIREFTNTGELSRTALEEIASGEHLVLSDGNKLILIPALVFPHCAFTVEIKT